jgi:hypothetical protein
MPGRYPIFTNLDGIPSKAEWIMPIVILVLSIIISGLSGYFHDDRVLAERLTTVEAHQGDTKDRLDRIESKIDAQNRKLDVLTFMMPRPAPQK